MRNAELRLYLDRLDAKSPLLLLECVTARALYVIEGSVALRTREGGTVTTLGANSGTLVGGTSAGGTSAAHAALSGGSLAGTLLRWELVAAADAPEQLLGSDSKLLLAAPMALDPAQSYLLRGDRVDFPPGGEALTHTHQGGGIRCLLFGSIRIDTLGASHRYAPLGAWFEAGPDPVYAAADAAVPSAFARVMVLPRSLLGGKSSISYVRSDDLDKPKSQRYQLFVDEPISLRIESKEDEHHGR